MCLITHTDQALTPLFIRKQGHKLSTFEGNMIEQFGKDTVVFITNAAGKVLKVSLPDQDWLSYGNLSQQLKKGVYQFQKVSQALEEKLALAFALGSYQFKGYKTGQYTQKPELLVSKDVYDAVHPFIDAITLVRDLINAPANHMGPMELAAAARGIVEKYNGHYECIMGEELKKEYPLVHLVGKGAEKARAPRFITLSFNHPKASKTVALVGKGVCFDTGGLNIKPDSGMLLMKKDMGGAAQILGLTQLLLAKDVFVNLKVYLPIVENAVDSRAMRPLDIVTSRAGLTVEVGHTDAEGRLILADALTRASEDAPDLIIDCATLTGAARVALGPEIPAFFTNTPWVVSTLYECSENTDDPLWQLPLYHPYKSGLKASHVDIKNVAGHSYAGAIIAALFLEAFIKPTIPWLHIDFMGWNPRPRPSFPEGGDAQGLRALFELIKDFCKIKV